MRFVTLHHNNAVLKCLPSRCLLILFCVAGPHLTLTFPAFSQNIQPVGFAQKPLPHPWGLMIVCLLFDFYGHSLVSQSFLVDLSLAVHHSCRTWMTSVQNLEKELGKTDEQRKVELKQKGDAVHLDRKQPLGRGLQRKPVVVTLPSLRPRESAPHAPCAAPMAAATLNRRGVAS